MRKLSLLLLLALVCVGPLSAQQMSVEELVRLKGRGVKTLKNQALLDLVTDEKGFTFLSDGNQPAQAEEGDGSITVTLPGHTTHLVIRHPDFGQYTWRIPHRGLQSRKHYRALLFAVDPTKDFKATHQWVVFRLNPENTLLQVDSVTRRVRQEVVEWFLPVGEHQYKVEAPFHSPQEGSFTLTDAGRTDISVSLQPFYSFLSVKTGWELGELYIDSTPILREEATSYRIAEGYHRVNWFYEERCYYDTLVYVGHAQKKVLQLEDRDWRLRPIKKGDPLPAAPAAARHGADSTGVTLTPVTLTAADPEAEIWLDRELVGKGRWEGTLPLGFHLVTTRKDGEEGLPTRLWLDDDFPQEITLPAVGTGYGLLNVHCDVAGASIRIDGREVGPAPQLLRLDASRNYDVTLYKEGYRPQTKTVRPKGNHQVEVYLKLKKK